MKKIVIDEKEYWQQEEKDIPKIPMLIDKDILKNYPGPLANKATLNKNLFDRKKFLT